jgi:hypothetical protein
MHFYLIGFWCKDNKIALNKCRKSKKMHYNSANFPIIIA